MLASSLCRMCHGQNFKSPPTAHLSASMAAGGEIDPDSPSLALHWLHCLGRLRRLMFEAGSRWSRIGGFELLLHLQKPILSHGIFNAEGRREEALLVEEEEVLIDGLSAAQASSIKPPEVIETLETPHFHPLFFGQKECQHKSGQKKIA